MGERGQGQKPRKRHPSMPTTDGVFVRDGIVARRGRTAEASNLYDANGEWAGKFDATWQPASDDQIRNFFGLRDPLLPKSTKRKRGPSMPTTEQAIAQHKALAEALGTDDRRLPLGDVHEGLLAAAADPVLRPAIEQHIREASDRRAQEISAVRAEAGKKGGWRHRKELDHGK